MSNSAFKKAIILVVVVFITAVIIYPKITSNQGEIRKNLNLSPGERALENALKSGKPTMILFHSNSCVLCKQMLSIVAKVKPLFAKRANFVDISVEDKSEVRLISKFGIEKIPTSVFLDRSGKLIAKNIGVVKKEQLIKLLNSLEK
ncbi:MAG: thioredoxin fold domain-containing protein [Actinomycetota bacterium]|nr:thioredoxin fold domain-containing protein [Actinomycetota bacterium]